MTKQDTYPGPDFWQGKYDEDHLPWDLGKVSGPVETLVRHHFPPAGRVFIPASGRGFEALYLAQRGYRVTALDIVAPPLDFLRAQANQQGLEIEILHQDMFTLPERFDGAFDVFLEQTCLCALAPPLYPDYEVLAYRVLKPGGRLMGVFMEVAFDDGPPFNTPPDLVMNLFPPERWRAEGPEPIVPKNPDRPGPEYLARFTKLE